MLRDGVFLPVQAKVASPSTGPPYPLDQDEEKEAPEPSPSAPDEDPFAPLAHFDTVFLIDDSESMRPYWDEVYEAVAALVGVCCEHDPNGVDLYFVNHRPRSYIPLLSPRKKSGYRHIGLATGVPEMRDNVEGILNGVRAGGPCQLGRRLRELLLDDYVSEYAAQVRAGTSRRRRPLNLIVIAAGLADDLWRDTLVLAAQELDRVQAPAYQAGVQLFQVGRDPEARRRMQAEDDMFRTAKTRDMVDTVTWSGPAGVLSDEGVLKAVLGAVQKTLDRHTLTPLGLLMPEPSSPADAAGDGREMKKGA